MKPNMRFYCPTEASPQFLQNLSYPLLSMKCSHNGILIYLLQIKWRPVLWGMSLQFVFALIILRTSQGFIAFKFIGDKITRFLDYTDVGSAFVFGENFAVHYIAFKVSRKL